VIAEALKILGYVNRFGRGVIDAQNALAENGSPQATFEFQPNFVLATIQQHPDT
jgi:ATP-dependent DNA helicase RecG